ncbi:hypothetical protein C8Q73DRAFT_279532 [Cubamyces lactineus]|nr:hypothetical protein C8Q73DRAFT_279532 [Cubamyces lactineus]
MVYSIVVTSSEHVIDPARDERGCENRGMTHRTAPGEFIRPWTQSAIRTAVRKDRRRGDVGCRACRRELLSMRIQYPVLFGVGPSARSLAPVFARFLSDPGLRTCALNRMSMMDDDVDGRVRRQDLHRSISSAPPRRLTVRKGVYNGVTPLPIPATVHRPPSPPSHAAFAIWAISVPSRLPNHSPLFSWSYQSASPAPRTNPLSKA